MASSILLYVGGKAKLAGRLEEMCPRAPVMVSPFFGGGGYELYMARKHGVRVLANDADGNVHNFWTVAKDPALRTQLVRRVRELWTEPFKAVKAEATRPNVDGVSVDHAAHFWVASRKGFRGQIYGGVGENRHARLECAVRALTTTYASVLEEHLAELSNEDYRAFLTRTCAELDARGESYVVFLDPPYEVPRRTYYRGHASFSHDDLHDFLLRSDVMRGKTWVLCSADTPRVRDDFASLVPRELVVVGNHRPRTELVTVVSGTRGSADHNGI